MCCFQEASPFLIEILQGLSPALFLVVNYWVALMEVVEAYVQSFSTSMKARTSHPGSKQTVLCHYRHGMDSRLAYNTRLCLCLFSWRLHSMDRVLYEFAVGNILVAFFLCARATFSPSLIDLGFRNKLLRWLLHISELSPGKDPPRTGCMLSTLLRYNLCSPHRAGQWGTRFGF